MENKEEKALRYNSGKPKWSLIDFESLLPLVEVLEYGAHKYSIYEDDKGNQIRGSEIPIEDINKYKLISSGKDNWKKGLDSNETLESLARHLFKLINKEEFDKESKLSHVGHIMANIMFYQYHKNK